MLKRPLLGFLMVCATLAQPVLSAPLFPDVKDDHWAKDAVAALAAKGLLEGYPDGTFKGDRAASRWEVAMIVARLLAKMEQAHATFATKAELEELRKLANSLKDELDALGVRVKNLEEATDRLDRRVTELERITFYGYVDARATVASFYNTGSPAMTTVNGGVQLVNYNSAVGSAVGAGGVLPPVPGRVIPPTWNPFSLGVLSTTNWRTGRPLVSGVGFTSKAILGVKVKVSDDIDAGAEFAAYASQGNTVLDAYYGVSANYLSNPWTSTVSASGVAGQQSLDHTPYTRMTLDHIWVIHNPSQTKLVLGAFNHTDFHSTVFSGMKNPNEFGPEHLDNYGMQLTGKHSFDDKDDFKIRWEVMGTKLPNGNLGALPGTPGAGASYFSHAEGFNFKLLFNDERGHVQFNFLHAADEATTSGGASGVGLIQTPNLVLNWVNPNGFYFNQLGGPNLATAGISTTSDVRPVPGLAALNNDGSLAALVAAGLLPQGLPNLGGVGPQDQKSYGVNFSYRFDNEYEPRVYGEWAHSDYRPSKNAAYTASGNAWKFGGGAFFVEKQVELDVHYLSVDPRYDPFLIMHPAVAVQNNLWHTPDFNFYNNLMSLHDTADMTPNRQGIRVKALWKFRPTGRLTVEYGHLTQTQTSLQDVRFSAGALGVGIPNTPVLGYSPGFMEPVFGGFSPYTFAASGGNALAIPLENNRGTQENLYISAGHKFLLEEEINNRGVTISAGMKYVHFSRDSQMSRVLPGSGFGMQAENQNLVDLGFKGIHFGVDYDVTEDFTVKGGYTIIDIWGHLDPLNAGGQYAESIGSARFNNVDITQRYPDLGFEWKINDDITWGMEGRYYTTTDNLPSRMFINPSVTSLNINSGPAFVHPFNWEGLQLNTHFGFKF